MTDAEGGAGARGAGAGAEEAFAGRFVLGALLGSGGSSSVYTAADLTTGSLLALKILHPHLSAQEAQRAAFHREARLAQRVQHPNVIGVLDLGVAQIGGEPVAWIALENANGMSLAERVGHAGPLSVADALATAEGILRALEAVHAQGLAHRDVTPVNVIVPPSGEITAEDVRLIDFGLADARGRRALGRDVLRTEQTPEGPAPGSERGLSVVGNVHYLSPEQALGRPLDERSDLYQTAAVLYFMITGSPPFPRPDVASVLDAHASAPPPVPSVSRRGVSRDVDRIVVRGLLKSADDRYGDAADMRRAVREAWLGTLVPAGPGVAAHGGVTVHAGTAAEAAPAARSSGAGVATAVEAPAADAPTAVLSGSAPPRSAAATRSPGATPSGRQPPRRPVGTTSVPHRALDDVPAPGAAAIGRDGRSRGGLWWFLLIAAAAVLVAWWLAIASPAQTAPPAALPTPTASATSSAPPTPAPPTTAAVPDLAGASVEQARQALAALGLVLGATQMEDSPAPANLLLRTMPAAGAASPLGSTVDLVVSSGWSRVPALTALSQDAAIASAQAAGFGATVYTRESATAAPGSVIASEPLEGTRLLVHSTVVLIVATAPPAPEVTPDPVPTPPGPGPQPTGQPTPTPTPGS